MSRPPVDEHTEDFDQLAGLSALDVLEGEELARFERHAAQCTRCQMTVRLDREALALAAPEMDPSPDFKTRLLERAAHELFPTAEPSVPAQTPTPIRPAPKVIPFWRRSAWASALAAVLVIGLVSAGAYSYENQVVASYALAGSVPGRAVVNVRRSGAAELEMSGVADPPPGFLYEAWIIPRNSQPIAAGVTASGQAKLPLNSVSNGSTVAVTQERARVEAPTSAPILAVVIQS